MTAESEQILIELLDEETSDAKKSLLLEQLGSDTEALQAYQLIVGAEGFIQDLPLESPSSTFNDGVLLGYKRLKTREANSRLVTYFVGIMAAIIALMFSFTGESTTVLPSSSAPLLEKITQKLPKLAILVEPDSLLQLVLVLNACLVIVLLEKIVSKKKILDLHSSM